MCGKERRQSSIYTCPVYPFSPSEQEGQGNKAFSELFGINAVDRVDPMNG